VRLITGFEIINFRSIKHLYATDILDFAVFCGLNNAGKSNILRALNAFFNSHTDESVLLSLDIDYSKLLAKSRQKQKIEVAVFFKLPDRFTFRSGLEPVHQLLSAQEFKITKTWTREQSFPEISLDDQQLNFEDSQRIFQFLSLIAFRYIPNRVLPTDVISAHHEKIKDSLIRRLKLKKSGSDDTFASIKSQAELLLGNFAEAYSGVISEFAGARLATPQSWADLIFNLAFQVPVGDKEVADVFQGSGAQSVLMLETLKLIDSDYYKQFGWKQATIWAYEEPESSLHHSLESLVASKLNEFANNENGRLQIIGTTHSPSMIEHANSAYIVKRRDNSSIAEKLDTALDYDELWESGTTPWVHPLLQFPKHPLIMVEGKFDRDVFDVIRNTLPEGRYLRCSFVGNLDPGNGKTGGDDELYNYLRTNTKPIDLREAFAPVVVILDWDSAGKRGKFEKITNTTNYHVFVFSDDWTNPELGKEFRGIERALSTKFVKEAATEAGIDTLEKAGQVRILPEDYDKLKTCINRKIGMGVDPNDFGFVKRFYDHVIATINLVKPVS